MGQPDCRPGCKGEKPKEERHGPRQRKRGGGEIASVEKIVGNSKLSGQDTEQTGGKTENLGRLADLASGGLGILREDGVFSGEVTRWRRRLEESHNVAEKC